MNRFETDVARATLYKLAYYNQYMEKDAGIREALSEAAIKYTPTFYSAGKQGLKAMEKHLPTFYPPIAKATKGYLNGVADIIDDFWGEAGKVIAGKNLLPSSTDDIIKSIVSPISGFAAGMSTSPVVRIPLEIAGSKAKDIYKKIPGNTDSIFMNKLRSASGAAASGLDLLKKTGVKSTLPNNVLGLLPYSAGLAAGGFIPIEAYPMLLAAL